jgi:hypothetical protein
MSGWIWRNFFYAFFVFSSAIEYILLHLLVGSVAFTARVNIYQGDFTEPIS